MQTDTHSSQPVTLPPLGNISVEEATEKGRTHWGWTPYKDINNMGPAEIRSQLGYREQRWITLQRCVPYPFGNLTFSEVDRAAVAEVHASGFSMNFDSSTAPKVVYTKYAGDQVAELWEQYKDEGFRGLTPLTGMDDSELVGQIVQVVQPFAYLIHEMEYEFTVGAENRIEGSNLSKNDKRKAYEVVAIMANGAEDAKKRALKEYAALISSMSDKMAGGPGVSNPEPFHEWICLNLNKPVPQRIDRTGSQQSGGADSGWIKQLLDRDAERARELAELKQQVAAKAEAA